MLESNTSKEDTGLQPELTDERSLGSRRVRALPYETATRYIGLGWI